MSISSRYATQLFALFMSFTMAFIMTAFVTWVNTGMDDGYTGRWMHAFTLAWPLALVCLLLLTNRIRGLVTRLTTQ